MEKQNRIAAMDIGSSSVTLAVGERNSLGELVLVDVTSRPMQGIVRGEINNRQQVAESIRGLLQEVWPRLGMSFSDLYIGTSGRHIRCAGHDYHVFVGGSDGEVRREDVDALHRGMENVQAEEGVRIMDRIPQRYVVGGNVVKDPVGIYGKKLEANYCFVLGSTSLIDRLEKALMPLGVRARKTLANAIASAEAATVPEEREMGVAVVDLGAGTTDVCVWFDNSVRFVRGIPFGSADIDNDIHQQGILEKHVEGLKINFGRAMARLVPEDKRISITGRSPREKQEILQKNLATIIEHRLREIAGFVVEEIGDSGYAGRLRGGIVLTGGGAKLAGIDELFREVTGMEVRIAGGDARVAEESRELASDPAHATVVGLLLKAMEDNVSARPTVFGNVGEGAPDDDGPDEEFDEPRKKSPRKGFDLMGKLSGWLAKPLDDEEI